MALALAECLGGEIVNADAFQLYQGLDICTAKPPAADFARVRHHLFGVLALSEGCDAQRYADLAHSVIADISRREKLPIVVGGSGLYVKSLTHGLSPLPKDESLRKKLSHLTAHERIAWLTHRDPAAAREVNLKNDRHVSRALEICLLTGRPQSELRRDWQSQTPEYRGIRLVAERDWLQARINQRVLDMLRAGLVEEIKNLPVLSATAEKAIGIREIRAHLDGQIPLDDAVAAIQLATRQYARRQDKWFRREKGFTPIAVDHTDSALMLLEKVFAAMPGLRIANEQ